MHSPRFIPRTKTLFPAGFNLPQRRNLPKLCYGSGLSWNALRYWWGISPGDQGKAVGHNDSNLLSQIALHDMYASAFEAGAPLKVSPQSLPKELLSQLWRAMPPELQLEFTISESLVERFNAWREFTLNLSSDSAEASTDAFQYNPIRASSNVIAALENQLGWITAWRIGRYVNGAYKSQGFYKSSGVAWQNKDSDPATLAASKAEQERKQKDVDDERLTAIVDNRFKNSRHYLLAQRF